MFHHQNVGQNNTLITVNKYCNSVMKFKFVEMTITCIHKEITITLSLRNACYYSVQNLLYTCLLFKNLIKIYGTIILLLYPWAEDMGSLLSLHGWIAISE
jgi:hypothetical protein